MAAIRKQMPSMPDLNLNFTQDEEEEEEKKDEENLLSIMIKLKKAKDDNESTRKRKQFQEGINNKIESVSKDNKDQVAKHRKKWSVRTKQMSTRLDGITELHAISTQKSEECLKACMSAAAEHRLSYNRLIGQFKALEKEIDVFIVQNKEMLQKEAADARLQVSTKMSELENGLKKIQKLTVKDDAFSQMIKTAMISLQ